jgi:hypothetical protein
VPPFGKRIAHGYFVLSAAAGLFVSPSPGPVLANYGLDTLRFVKPVGIGDTIQARPAAASPGVQSGVPQLGRVQAACGPPTRGHQSRPHVHGAGAPAPAGHPVLEVELNADGSVRRITVQRQPSQARDTVQLAIDAVQRAAPFGDVSHLPRPWKFSEVFLFRDDRRFKPRALDL